MPDCAGQRLGPPHTPTVKNDRERGAVAVTEVGEEDVLLCREPELRTQGLDHLAQRGPQPAGLRVMDASVLNEQSIAMVSIPLFVPPKVIVGPAPAQAARVLERKRQP